MTSKPPSVNVEESDGHVSGAPAEEPKSDATDESKQLEVGDDADDSLEAILLQASAKAPEPAPPKPLGSKTLMGIGIEGLNLPALLREEGKKHKEKQKNLNNKDTKAKNVKARKKSAAAEAEPDVHVNDLVEEAGAAADPVQAADNVSVPDSRSGRSLLDDVAQALNVQASEVRDKARGRLPGMTHAGAGPGAPGRGKLPFLSRGSGASDAEFEDPSEGPTALTPGMIAIAEAEKATGQKSAQDAELEAEEEAVVLGHAMQSGSAKYAQARTSESRPVAVPPVPGLSAATPVVVGPPPGVVMKVSTPVGGLPLPSSGRTWLPTSMPGPAANSGSHPTGAINYQTLPFGMASPVVSDVTATAPSTPISLEASRRFAASLGSSGDAVPVRRTARVTEPVVRLATVFPAVLTAHVKLATLSLAGLIAVTFAGGLFVGMVVGKGQGQGRVEPPAGTHAGISAPATPAAATVQPTGAATAVGAAAAVQPASAATAVGAAAAVQPAGAATALGAAAAPAASGASHPAAALPSSVPPAVIPATEPAAPLQQAVVSRLPQTPPSENEVDGKTAKPTARAPHPKKTPAPATATASESPTPAPKVAVVKSTAHPSATASESSAPVTKVAAVKSTAHPSAAPSNASKPVTSTSSSKSAATAVSGKPATATALSKPMANNATSKPATKSKTKTTWHDPFAD